MYCINFSRCGQTGLMLVCGDRPLSWIYCRYIIFYLVLILVVKYLFCQCLTLDAAQDVVPHLVYTQPIPQSLFSPQMYISKNEYPQISTFHFFTSHLSISASSFANHTSSYKLSTYILLPCTRQST